MTTRLRLILVALLIAGGLYLGYPTQPKASSRPYWDTPTDSYLERFYGWDAGRHPSPKRLDNSEVQVYVPEICPHCKGAGFIAP